MSKNERKRHLIIPTSQGVSYKSLCGTFEVSLFHKYGMDYVADEVWCNGVDRESRVTCKSCSKSIKSEAHTMADLLARASYLRYMCGQHIKRRISN
jgi:hypothetical protein